MGTQSAKKLRKHLRTKRIAVTSAEYRMLKRASSPKGKHEAQMGSKEARSILLHQLDLEARRERRRVNATSKNVI